MEQFMGDGICSDMSQPRKQLQQHDINQPLHPYQYQQPQPPQQQYYHHHFHPYPHHLPQFLQEQHFSTPTPPPEQQPLQQQMFLPPVHDLLFHHHHPIPITQQLLQQTHHFHLFQQEQQRRQQNNHLDLDIDPQTPPEKSASPPRIAVGSSSGGGDGIIPAFLAPSMNFRLSVNENSGGGCNDDAILQSDEVDGSDSHWPPPPTSSREDNDTTIKEPFWRPLDLDMDYINRNNKRYKEKNLHHLQYPGHHRHHELELEENGIKQHFKQTEEPTEEGANNTGSNYKLFSELEAICKPTGSSSALTGENPPPALAAGLSPVEDNKPKDDIDHHKRAVEKEKGRRRRRRRRRRKEQLNSIVTFFEALVKELVDRQESLHGRFFEVLEKRDSERMAMEEVWREREARNSSREAKAREQEQAMAAAREGAILSFLEKIARESLNLPSKEEEEEEEEDNNNNNNNNNKNSSDDEDDNQEGSRSSNRWPKAEVQGLIKVRSEMEKRFQEAGLRGRLWEEVSSTMAMMGYRRNAKRCMEKWEKINKYLRCKKKRTQHSNQFDELYSKYGLSPSSSPIAGPNIDGRDRARGNSELLEDVVVSNDRMIGFECEFNPSVNDHDKRPLEHHGDHDVDGDEDNDNEAEGGS